VVTVGVWVDSSKQNVGWCYHALNGLIFQYDRKARGATLSMAESSTRQEGLWYHILSGLIVQNKTWDGVTMLLMGLYFNTTGKVEVPHYRWAESSTREEGLWYHILRSSIYVLCLATLYSASTLLIPWINMKVMKIRTRGFDPFSPHDGLQNCPPPPSQLGDELYNWAEHLMCQRCCCLDCSHRISSGD
jgi:hypothetical protein